jgi:hypothetical protein
MVRSWFNTLKNELGGQIGEESHALARFVSGFSHFHRQLSRPYEPVGRGTRNPS